MKSDIENRLKRRKIMFRLWGKEFKDNRMLRDTVICDDSDETRTHKIFNAAGGNLL